jgi:hypothetical protein
MKASTASALSDLFIGLGKGIGGDEVIGMNLYGALNKGKKDGDGGDSGGDKEADNKPKDDKPEKNPNVKPRDATKDKEKGVTTEEQIILDRDEELGYCSMEDQEIYAKRFQNGDGSIVFDKE